MGRRAALTEKQVKRIRQLRGNGYTYKQILEATRYDVTVATLRKACNRLGVYA